MGLYGYCVTQAWMKPHTVSISLYRGIQGKAGTCKHIQGYSGERMIMQGIHGNTGENRGIQGNTEYIGK